MISEIDPMEVHRRKEQNPRLVLIDVRRPDEFAQVHASYAQPIPLHEFETATSSVPLPPGLAKDSEIYFICRSGARSRKAAEITERFGYTNLYNVTGGTLRWLEEDLPTQS